MNKCLYALIASMMLLACGESRHESAKRMDPVNMSDIKIKDDFWTPYLLTHKDVTLPICVDWIEDHFDSAMVAKVSEGIEYSLQFEDDPELKVKRSGWITRIRNKSEYHLPEIERREINDRVSELFREGDSLLLRKDGTYADKMEQLLYNKVLAGITLKGDLYFSELPSSSNGNWSRQNWEETPSCAADLFRAIPSMANYAYATTKGTLWVNFFIGGRAKITVDREEIIVDQVTSYPWDGYMSLRLGVQKPTNADIRIRIPSWCEDFTLTVNGNVVNAPVKAGYAALSGKWQNNDSIELILDMPVKVIDECLFGKKEGTRAVCRGPLIYCAEEIDNPSWADNLKLSPKTDFKLEDLPKRDWFGHPLTRIKASDSGMRSLSMIPYFAWGNRAPGKMEVFIPYDN